MMKIDTPTFDRQLGNIIKSFSVLLRSGYRVRRSFSIIGGKAPDPVAIVFKHVVEKLDAGTDAHEIFNALKAHVPSSHLGVVLDTMLGQRQEGGNLADKLDPITEQIVSAAGQDPASDEVLQAVRTMMSTPDDPKQ